MPPEGKKGCTRKGGTDRCMSMISLPVNRIGEPLNSFVTSILSVMALPLKDTGTRKAREVEVAEDALEGSSLIPDRVQI